MNGIIRLLDLVQVRDEVFKPQHIGRAQKNCLRANTLKFNNLRGQPTYAVDLEACLGNKEWALIATFREVDLEDAIELLQESQGCIASTEE